MHDHRCTGALSTAGLSRRDLLNRVGLGLGGITFGLLAWLFRGRTLRLHGAGT